MGLLDILKNALQKPARPSGDPEEFAGLRERAYQDLFCGLPVQVMKHDEFLKPPFGGRIDVHLYELPHDPSIGQVHVAITSGMSDYRMSARGQSPVRREIFQYFRECQPLDMVRLHDMAWLPIAQGFCLDFFETLGPHPSKWPGALFVPSVVRPHAEFQLKLNGDEMRLLWHIPLSEAELDFKLQNGVDALLKRMTERDLPWIFDESNRPALV